MTFQFAVPNNIDKKEFMLESGESIIFVGANGGGKTRLAVFIENILGEKAHRISAHRALNLNPGVAKISEKSALSGLRTGNPGEGSYVGLRDGHRWAGQAAVKLLNDFDYLIQALFADQSNTSLIAYNQYKPGAAEITRAFKLTKFDSLQEVWTRLLPDRQLHISGDNILVSVPNSLTTYTASEMSDGERAIFYMIGQVLVADQNTVLIVDEPELHVHRSIMSKLWDELEAIRPDCAFVFITHDLEFAAVRAAQKFIIRNYVPAPSWTIEDVPTTTGFDEELTTLILGSRRPILFVEGADTSLDIAIYRCCYPNWTVIPRGSCSDVIHSVVTMRANSALTRVTCSGIIDADDYDTEDKKKFDDLGIKTLPVSEIENLILLPDISSAIAESEGYVGQELHDKLAELSSAIFEEVNTPIKIEDVVSRYCKRRIDRLLKKIDLSPAKTVTDISIDYKAKTADLDIETIAQFIKDQIESAVANKDLTKLLALYDNKGLLAIASKKLKSCHQSAFEKWLTRTFTNGENKKLATAISTYLPALSAY